MNRKQNLETFEGFLHLKGSVNCRGFSRDMNLDTVKSDCTMTERICQNVSDVCSGDIKPCSI